MVEVGKKLIIECQSFLDPVEVKGIFGLKYRNELVKGVITEIKPL